MFSDQFIRQQTASYRGSRRDPPTHAADTVSPAPPCSAAAGLGCKSKITLSQRQQLFIPPKSKSQSNSRRCSGATGAQRVNPRQPSSQQRHGVPTVMRSTRLPVVYSPCHSPSTGSRMKTNSSSRLKPNSSSPSNFSRPNSSRQFPFAWCRDNYSVNHSPGISPGVSRSPQKRSGDSKRSSCHTSGVSPAGTDSVRVQSIYSYLYDSERPGKVWTVILIQWNPSIAATLGNKIWAVI